MANDIYFSVGSSTRDFKTGSPTLDMSGLTGTFSTGQVGNIGVGCKVTYIEDGTAVTATNSTHITLAADQTATTSYFIDDNISIVAGTGSGQTRRITAYNGTTKVATTTPAWTTNPDNTSAYQISKQLFICSKISDTVWTMRTGRGNTPDSVTGKTVSSIKRSFNTLQAARHGTTTTYDRVRRRLNTWDLPARDLRVLIACYADGFDDSLVTLASDWITDATRYIMVFTPKTIIDASSPGVANQSQRHNGIVRGSSAVGSVSGYVIKSTSSLDYRRNLELNAANTKVFGLSIWRMSPNWTYGYCIGCNDYNQPAGAGLSREIAYNLCYQQNSGDDGGLIYYSNVQNQMFYGCSIHDNFVVSDATLLTYGISLAQDYGGVVARQFKIYNNTFYGKTDGGGIRISQTNSTSGRFFPYVKNNYSAVVGGLAADYVFAGDFSNTATNFAYNRSNDTSAGTRNSNAQCTTANAGFLSITSRSAENLHIRASSLLVRAGIGPSSDANVSTIDIDGDPRSGATCNVGADQLVRRVVTMVAAVLYSFMNPYCG